MAPDLIGTAAGWHSPARRPEMGYADDLST